MRIDSHLFFYRGNLLAVMCFDAKINFDDNAEFRQEEVFSMRDTHEEDPREVRATVCVCCFASSGVGQKRVTYACCSESVNEVYLLGEKRGGGDWVFLLIVHCSLLNLGMTEYKKEAR